MKKNTLLSIVLCAGLMLPSASFSAQQQTWADWMRKGFERGTQSLSSYLPQWDLSKWALSDTQKYVLSAAALAAAVGGAAYHRYYQPQPGLRKTTPVVTGPYAPGNLNNIALFCNALVNAPGFETIDPEDETEYPDELSAAQQMFKDHVLPVLTQLEVPKKPAGGSSLDQKREYDATVFNLWEDLIIKVKKSSYGSGNLNQPDFFYLEKLKKYINQQDRTVYGKLIKSINDAVDYARYGTTFPEIDTTIE